VQTHERFLKKVLDRQEEFRQSLAGAIHDDLIQQLVGALLYLEGARQIQSPPGDGAQDNFRIGLKLLREGIHKSRRIAGRLAAAVRRPS
jgi:signal transduction histidine kinase